MPSADAPFNRSRPWASFTVFDLMSQHHTISEMSATNQKLRSAGPQCRASGLRKSPPPLAVSGNQIAGQSPAGFSARWGFGGWALAAVTFESEVLGTDGFWERAGLLLLLATRTAKSGQRTVPSRKAEKRIK